MRWVLGFSVVISLLGTAAMGASHLVLVGGGIYSPEAMSQFTKWGGGSTGDYLIVSWATKNPQVALQRISQALVPFQPKSIQAAPSFEEMTSQKEKFLEQLQQSTGVFFTGGSQNRIMSVLADQEILGAIRRAFDRGTVIGGSSAGTAIMSRLMFTGAGNFTQIDPTGIVLAPGLGLLPGVVIDTHFLKRERENRLLSALSQTPEKIGIGIDEGCALAIEEGNKARVVGPGKVMVLVRQGSAKQFALQLLSQGDSVDLTPASPPT